MRYRTLLLLVFSLALAGCPTTTTPCDPACSSDQVCMNGTCYAPVDSGRAADGDAAPDGTPDGLGGSSDGSGPLDATNGGTDAGNGATDAGGTGFDANNGGTDAGGTGFDANNGGTDAGNGGFDAGPVRPPQDLDLLFVIDNSNSMRDNQTGLLNQLGAFVHALTDPPCTSDASPAPHACDPANAGDRPVYTPVGSLHFAVVDTDLGTPSAQISGCANPNFGDDGALNPIHYGGAIAQHEPWAGCGLAGTPPAGFRPADCTDPAQFPAFLSYDSTAAGSAQEAQFVHDMQCNSALYLCGCGLESPIEAAFRALVWHGAGPVHPPNGDLRNAGFLRDNALLAIVMLTDEEDGSVQNCAYAMPGEPCSDRTGVYREGTPAWASDNPNLRFYLYQPGGAQDPTWPMNRYLDPANPDAGFLALKPGHPEKVVFAAITGVPLPVPHVAGGANAIDWDALLGRPSSNGANDFVGRDESTAASGVQAGVNGPYSMRPQLVSGCTDLLEAACFREGGAYDPSMPCATSVYRALPSRRVVELARRFDQAPLCNGAPCGNGYVDSICAGDYGPAVQNIAQLILRRL